MSPRRATPQKPKRRSNKKPRKHAESLMKRLSAHSPLVILAWNIILVIWLNRLLYSGEKQLSLGIVIGGTLALVGYSAICLRSWALQKLDSLPIDRALISGLAPLFLILGAQKSSAEIFSMAAMPYYAIGNLAFAYSLLGPQWLTQWTKTKSKAQPVKRPAHPLGMIVGLTMLSAGIAWAIFGLREYAFAHFKMDPDVFSVMLFYLTRTASATDITGAPFLNYTKLWAPVLFIISFGVFCWLATAKLLGRRRLLLTFLVAFGLLGKIAIAHLSTQGVGVLGKKITSINNNYYTLSDRIDSIGLRSYMKDYNQIQGLQGNHGDTHPFGPIVFYWILKKLLGGHPTLVALSVMLLACLTIIPIFLISEKIFRSTALGFAAGALYLTTPMSLILSGAGIDAMILLLMALSFYGLVSSTHTNSRQGSYAAGICLFVATMFSAGSTLFLMFSGLWVLCETLKLSSSFSDWVQKSFRVLLPVLGLLAGLHLLLYLFLGGSFSYRGVMDTALYHHRGMNQRRPYDLWIWANIALYIGFAGVPIVAAWLIQTIRKFQSFGSFDTFSVLSLPLLYTLVFACMGRAEVQREFLYGIFFLVIPAVPLLAASIGQNRPSKLVPKISMGLFITLIFYNYINAMFLEIKVLDFW